MAAFGAFVRMGGVSPQRSQRTQKNTQRMQVDLTAVPDVVYQKRPRILRRIGELEADGRS